MGILRQLVTLNIDYWLQCLIFIPSFWIINFDQEPETQMIMPWFSAHQGSSKEGTVVESMAIQLLFCTRSILYICF
ncbi:hypothetical protein XENTR_v10017890 [Xenopus tropicalis]|nr:hypothetical protein XENTR_v10017890 [Xenopus tropicalis]